MQNGTQPICLSRLWKAFFRSISVSLLILTIPHAPFSNIDTSSYEVPLGAYLNGIFPPSRPGGDDNSWEVEVAYPNLTFADPLAFIDIPHDTGFYVAGKRGMVWKISNDTATSTKSLVLDISSTTHTDGDAGLSNFILHPEFGVPTSPHRGYAYAIYRYHPQGDLIFGCEADAWIRLSRFTRPDGVDTFDVSSEYVLVQQFDEQCWHTGSGMFFDTEGYLYFTIGDAGGINDQYNTSQQIDSFLLGGLHRIDVDMDPTRSHPIRRQPQDRPHGLAGSSYTQGYYIPNDNPWQDINGGILEEFYALGLRSPHRASYDSLEQKIFVCDVGQGKREEINIVEKGDNLEWPYREGHLVGPKAKPNPLIGNSKAPVYDYSHSVGTAVIGGMVYRGDKFKTSLEGKFIFGDHGVRNIWAFNPVNHEVTYLANVPFSGHGSKNGISSFGTDSLGNVYVLKLFATDQDGGQIYKLKQTTSVPDPPLLLSQIGAFSDLGTLTPAAGVMPFDVNTPLWTDGAEKKRWIAVPSDGVRDQASEQVVFSEFDPWQFPAGTVIIKHFEMPVDLRDPQVLKRMETRFLVITQSSEIYGVTYKWNELGTDATLLTSGETVTLDITQHNGSTLPQDYYLPSRIDCQTCHNSNAGYVLGVRTSQLNGDVTYQGNVTDNQLRFWSRLNLFSNPFSFNEIPLFPKAASLTDENAPLETRVRSYLETNCAHCHRPNGVQAVFDARYQLPLDQQYLVNTVGVSLNTPLNNLIVKPQDHINSELWIRDQSLDGLAMPPLAKNVVDTAYISVLEDWIGELEDPSCFMVYLSDTTWLEPSYNEYGPIERDQNNGGTAPDDGGPITINGHKYLKGLGTSAYSEVRFDIDSKYSKFRADIGVDEVACSGGDVIFKVELDGQEVYSSPVMTRNSNPISLDINIHTVDILTLKVLTADGDINCDMANWADARLIRKCDDGDACTTDDTYDLNCDCVGTLIDTNEDGVCDNENFELNINVYLNGAFVNPHPEFPNLMRDDLRSNNLIPRCSPYDDAAPLDSSVLDLSGPDAIIDWIWVELRQDIDETNILEGRSLLIQRDGDIVDLDGTSLPVFGAGIGSHHVVIRHRNHLPIMSDLPIAVNPNSPTIVNFANGSIPARGTDALQVLSGKYCMWAGDCTSDGLIDASDRSTVWNDRNKIEYHNSDGDMTGVVDAGDRSLVWNNRNQYSQVPEP